MAKRFFEEDFIKNFKDDKTLGRFTRLYMSIPYTYLGDLKMFDYTEEELLIFSEYFLFDFKNKVYYSQDFFNYQPGFRNGYDRKNNRCFYIVKQMIKYQHSYLSGVLFHNIVQEHLSDLEEKPADIMRELSKHVASPYFVFWKNVSEAIKNGSVQDVYTVTYNSPKLLQLEGDKND